MSTRLPIQLLRMRYAEAAQAYLRMLRTQRPEHFMESTTQARQRKITLESLDLVSARRPEVQVFNELLVQYTEKGSEEVRQVVPDNMVVTHREPIEAEGSFDVELQPVGPLWVLEYVSKHSKRKDNEESFPKYERALKVPYLLLFYPDDQEVTLYRHNRRRYVSVKPNENGRLAIPDLELEVALLDGWVRFWFRGDLLPLPADLQAELDEQRRRNEQLQRRLNDEGRRADDERRRADDECRRADDERNRADGAERRLADALAELERLRGSRSNG